MAESKGLGAEARSEIVHTIANELGRVIRDKYPDFADKLGGGALPKLLSRVLSVGVRSVVPDTPLGEDMKMGVTEFLSEITEGSKSASVNPAAPAAAAQAIPQSVAKEKLFSLSSDKEEETALRKIVAWLCALGARNSRSGAKALDWLNTLTKTELLAFSAQDDEHKDTLWALHCDDSLDWKDRLKAVGTWLETRISKPFGAVLHRACIGVKNFAKELDEEAVSREGILELRAGYLHRDLVERQDARKRGHSWFSLFAFWRL